MCAKIHNAMNATMRLRPCPTTRSTEPPPEAEYTTVSPSASVSASAAMSGPSMRRDRSSKARLIMLLVLRLVVLRLGKLGRVLLAEQEIVEDLARDGCGGRAAVLAVLD